MPVTTSNTPAATWGEASISLHGFLGNLQRQQRLIPVLRAAVVEQFVVDQAKAAGLVVTTEELQQAANLFRRRLGLNSAEATRTWLQREHLSIADLEVSVQNNLLIDKYKDHLFKARLNEHFVANRSRYDLVALRVIMVGREDFARELLSQIRDDGRDFAALAAEHSTHPSRGHGGLLGLLRRHQLADGVAGSVFAAKAGEVVGPLATPGGFQLLLVESLQPAQLDAPTAALIRQQLFDAWLAARLKETPIAFPLLDAL